MFVPTLIIIIVGIFFLDIYSRIKYHQRVTHAVDFCLSAFFKYESLLIQKKIITDENIRVMRAEFLESLEEQKLGERETKNIINLIVVNDPMLRHYLHRFTYNADINNKEKYKLWIQRIKYAIFDRGILNMNSIEKTIKELEEKEKNK